MKHTILYITKAAAVAAMYAALTLLLAPISFGYLQCRVSEALCVLPYIMPASGIGLFVGCLLGNLLTGAPWFDVVFGTLATGLAALLTYFIGKRGLPKWLAPLPAVVCNGCIVGAVLTYGYGIGIPFQLSALYVSAGEILSCYVIGLPLLYFLCKNPSIIGE